MDAMLHVACKDVVCLFSAVSGSVKGVRFLLSLPRILEGNLAGCMQTQWGPPCHTQDMVPMTDMASIAHKSMATLWSI